MGRPSGHINQYLANLIIDKKLLIWDKNDLRKYKKIYLTSKIYIFFKLEFNFLISEQLKQFIKAKINPINN